MSARRKPAQSPEVARLPLTLSISEFAYAFGVSRFSVHRWLAGGKLRAVSTPGGLRRIPRSELARLLEGDQ
jgi:excisionase family DNA binding protein